MLYQLPRAFTRRAAISNDGATIDEDIGHAFGILARVFIAGAFANSLGIEYVDIVPFGGLQFPTVAQMQDLCGETGHLADCLFEREQPQIAGVMPQNTRATAVGTWMGPAAEQTVGAHSTPGGPQDVLDVIFANHEGDHPYGKVLVEQETHHDIKWFGVPLACNLCQSQALDPTVAVRSSVRYHDILVACLQHHITRSRDAVLHIRFHTRQERRVTQPTAQLVHPASVGPGR